MSSVTSSSSPTEHSLRQVRQIRADIDASTSHPPQAVEDGLDAALSPGSDWRTPRLLRAAEFARRADRKYDKWRTTDLANHTCTFAQNLYQWLRHMPESHLATLLDAVPECCDSVGSIESFQLTAWQRLFVAVFVCLPFDYESSINIASEEVRAICGRDDINRNDPIEAHYVKHAGSAHSELIVDLGAGTGKTCTTLTLAFLHVGKHWAELVKRYRDVAVTRLHSATMALPVARLVVVATAGNTFHHFVETIKGLLPEFRRLLPDVPIDVWTQCGKSTNVNFALDDSRIIFWVVPIKELKAVLKQAPGVAIGVVVVDEDSVDTTAGRFKTRQSPVVTRILAQATPQLLEKSSAKSQSWLNHLFDGALQPPSSLKEFVGYRRWNLSTAVAEQACLLDCCTTGVFRHHIRDDVSNLLPAGLAVHYLPSRRSTVTSFLNHSSADFGPLNLRQAVLAKVAGARLTSDSTRRLEALFADGTVTLQAVIDLLATLETQRLSTHHPECNGLDNAVLRQLSDRLCEFVGECPICFESPTSSSATSIYVCCGKCVCSGCFERHRVTVAGARCPFCRSSLSQSLAETSTGEPAAQPTVNLASYEVPIGMPVIPTNGAPTERLSRALQSYGDPRKPQSYNFFAAMRTLVHSGYTRLFVILEVRHHSPRMRLFLDQALEHLSREMQLEIFHTKVNGKGTAFARVKARFDDAVLHPHPMAVVCTTADSNLLVGTDFGKVEAMVMVGDVSKQLFDQVFARTMRPSHTRDNTRYIPCVKIYS